jgi:hypothetical protein
VGNVDEEQRKELQYTQGIGMWLALEWHGYGWKRVEGWKDECDTYWNGTCENGMAEQGLGCDIMIKQRMVLG